jgi:hypothetical protein
MSEDAFATDDDGSNAGDDRRSFLVGGVYGMLELSMGGTMPRTSNGTVATVQDLQNRSDAPGAVAVEGYHEPGDGGSGLFPRASSPRASKVISTDRAKGALWVPGDGGLRVQVEAFNGPLNVK